ncbi:MAG: phospholipase D-like domain-containing protein, partial [Proteobacteria bacterium]|nr:phospholipase D-like domain-containing protein [Pseudomonadota bacterium]
NAKFLVERLNSAKNYDRIAGYFTSSLFEAAGDALESVTGPIRIVCNSEIDPRDLETARAAELAMKREWSGSIPEAKLIKERAGNPSRFDRLYHFLKSGKMQVRVLPSQAFGLIHGKAGVITLADGRKTSFLGSVNETIMGWEVNYELLWEDDSPEAIEWVQKEFDDLWNDPRARPLSEAVIEDIQRISKRVVLYDVEKWKTAADAAAAVIEEPIYRESIGLADHQKYFIRLAFDLHRGPHGARLVLADSVGLGKTVQLAMAAKLMALYGDKPILVVVPATLTRQWQTELLTLLNVPSAIWKTGRWFDENGEEYPAFGPEGIRKCPRRIGIVSQGLVTSNSEALDYIKAGNYECVIIDEAHRARRKNLALDRQDEKPDPNNLLNFILHISKRTHSLLLATATPVQVNPIEAWDLLNALGQGSPNILGNEHSVWRRQPSRAIALATGQEVPPTDESDLWEIVRNPFPQESESPKDIGPLRRGLKLKASDAVAPGDRLDNLSGPARTQLIERFGKNFVDQHNPFIRHIVRRTREYLENQKDLHGEPLLPKIEVELYGEQDPIVLPGYLRDAYQYAQDFCQLLRKRTK